MSNGKDNRFSLEQLNREDERARLTVEHDWAPRGATPHATHRLSKRF